MMDSVKEPVKTSLSVIIPCLNEEQNLTELLPKLHGNGNVEVIVVDGGSSDRSCDIVGENGCIILQSPRGRGLQMNLGAEKAKSGMLLFLHADTHLPGDFVYLIEKTLQRDGVAGGAFSLATDSSSLVMKFICVGANLRSKLFGLPYGDQAIFVTRKQFEAIGGFQEMAIMEDYVFMQNLRRYGKIVVLPDKATTSARRWKKLGVFKTTIINQLVVSGYKLGVSPERLAKLYKTRRRRG